MVVILSVSDDGCSERTWWWLFWVYLMVILSVPDDGYSECIWWWLFWVYLMMVILSVPDDGYSECTWWWLFWAYLMMVILSVPDEGYSRKVLLLLETFKLFVFPLFRLWVYMMKAIPERLYCSQRLLHYLAFQSLVFELVCLMKVNPEMWCLR
jgi:hypothetical protein